MCRGEGWKELYRESPQAPPLLSALAGDRLLPLGPETSSGALSLVPSSSVSCRRSIATHVE